MDEDLFIFDSHSHYTDEAFDPDRDALLSSFPEKGIRCCMVCGTDLTSSEACTALAERYPSLLITAVGVHPETPDAPAGYLSRLRQLAAHPSVKAIGEIGLDYHYDDCEPEQQKKILREQIALAKELNLPVILHCRDAMGDMLEILRESAPLAGVMHCFPGSAESAQEVLRLGLYIGFTGVITFKNAKKPLAALRSIPTDRLLLETDCPYMAPVPFRGKRCDSTMLTETAAVMAREKNVTVRDICRMTAENAARLFRVSL
ncbi:MAG: TatD family hydrolase [Oscillospiraceae bacterium]|nr:TatD family hydrolase [Oscillospiraceae bacterium]